MTILQRGKNTLTMLLVVALIVTMLPIGAVAVADNFSDLPESHWAYNTVSYLVEEGGINGYPDGTFKPSGTITAAEFVAILIRTTVGDQEQPEGKHWASAYFDMGAEKEIIPEGMFVADAWDKPISREKMAVLTIRAAEKVFTEEALADTEQLIKKISDYESCCDNCKPYVLQAYGKFIINGYPDGTFGPTRGLTRAEAATVIARLLNTDLRVPVLATVDPNEKIDFDRDRDVRPDGTMEELKSIEYMDQLLATLQFTGENGEYYVSGTFPELPDGYWWNLYIGVTYYKDKSVWSVSSKPTPYNTDKLPGTGSFSRRIDTMESVDEVWFVKVSYSITTENNLAHAGYSLRSDSDYLGVAFDGPTPAYANTYDVSKHFLWK